MFEFSLPDSSRRISGAGFTEIPRKGEMVVINTGEAPRTVYRVADVMYSIRAETVEITVILG